MFLPFLAALRDEGVPVSVREYLAFLEAVGTGLVDHDVDGFYHLGRAVLVKDETRIDRYDRAFARAFRGLAEITPEALARALSLPADWLERLADRHLTAEERAAVQALGGFEALMEALRTRLAEQKGRHEGGSKWIGTNGTSPFGAGGYNPAGVRIGQAEGRMGSAVKVWDRREFRNLDGDAQLGTRNFRVALRAIRAWARQGAAEELDLDATIRASAREGWIDVRTRPERRNAARVLLFLDVGGSMDAHVAGVEALFAAARSEFAHLETWYFHNCLYDHVWADNRRRHDARMPTADLLRSRGPQWTCVLVGDATMSPWEITHAGAATEHWNEEPGAVWLTRAAEAWPRHLWINPVDPARWDSTPSVGLIRGLLRPDRMVPMTPDGIARGTKALRR